MTARPRSSLVVAAAALASAALPAQIPWAGSSQSPYTRPPQGQAGAQGQGQQPGTVTTNGQFVPGSKLPGATNPFARRVTPPPMLQLNRGFPIYPSQFAGLGGYATTPDQLASPTTPTLMPPGAAVDEPQGWPAWARLKGKDALPFAFDAALLIRHAERVWFRAVDDEAFVPLAFHDKLRGLRAGAAIAVHSNGEFELLLHNSSRLIARGPTQLHLDELAEAKVALRAPTVSWLRIATTAREHAIVLPGGGTLRIAPPPPSVVPSFLPAPVPMSAPLPGVTDVVIDRLSEPGWLGGRATLTNLGSTEVQWETAAGATAIPPGHRIVFFVAAPAAVAGSAFVPGGATRTDEGNAVVCRADQPARVAWSGAAFDLPAGAAVRFDPQVGRPFAAPTPAAGTGRP